MTNQRSAPPVYKTPWGSGSRDNRGAELTITYGWHDIPGMGDVLIAATPRGICFIGLTVDQKRTRAENRLHDYFPAAEIAKNADATAGYAAGIEEMYKQRENCHPGNRAAIIRDLSRHHEGGCVDPGQRRAFRGYNRG